MKFNKKNILFKMMFTVLLVFMCFSVCDVEAATVCLAPEKNNCAKSGYKDTIAGVCSYSVPWSDGTMDIDVNELGTAMRVSGVLVTPSDLSEKKVFSYDDTNKSVYCPHKAYACKINYGTYFSMSKQECEEKKSKIGANEKIEKFETVEIAYAGGSHSQSYNYDVKNQKCVGTDDKTLFQAYLLASFLDGANAWSEENDKYLAALEKYVKDATESKTNFCSENALDPIRTVIKKYEEVVSKDPNAPQNSKTNIKKQVDDIEKNIDEIKKYTLSNKADIKILTGDLKKCEDLISEDLMYIINLVLKIIQIGGPILLIIFIAIDFAQVVISNDKDAMNKAVSKAIKRGLAAIALFFIPYLVSLILEWLNTYSTAGINATNCIK